MRSRYAAYTQAQIDYLAQTHHADTRDTFEPKSAAQWSEAAVWHRLEIVETADGQAEEGFVEFKAHFVESGRFSCLHERSRFLRVEGRWFYVDGEIFDSDPPTKVGRNEPCPCGSGKKFKKCGLPKVAS